MCWISQSHDHTVDSSKTLRSSGAFKVILKMQEWRRRRQEKQPGVEVQQVRAPSALNPLNPNI